MTSFESLSQLRCDSVKKKPAFPLRRFRCLDGFASFPCRRHTTGSKREAYFSSQPLVASLALALPPLNNERQWSCCNRSACAFSELCHAGDTTCWVVSARVVIRGEFRGQGLLFLFLNKDTNSPWNSFMAWTFPLYMERGMESVMPFLYVCLQTLRATVAAIKQSVGRYRWIQRMQGLVFSSNDFASFTFWDWDTIVRNQQTAGYLDIIM